LQAVKAGKFEDRYENALVELLNKKRKGEPVRTAVKPRDTCPCRKFNRAGG
jgi:non-homologous end joining protein Ku